MASHCDSDGLSKNGLISPSYETITMGEKQWKNNGKNDTIG